MIRLWLFGDWRWFLSGLWYYGVLTVVMLAAWWLVPRSGAENPGERFAAARTRQREATLAVVRLLGIGVLAAVLSAARGGAGLAADRGSAVWFVFLLVLLVGSAMGVAGAFGFGSSPDGRWDRLVILAAAAYGAAYSAIVDDGGGERWATARGVLLAVGFALYAAAGMRLWFSTEPDGEPQSVRRLLTVNAAAGLVIATIGAQFWWLSALAPLWTTTSFLVGLLNLVVACLDRGDRTGARTRRHLWRWWIPAGVAMAIAVQWAGATYSNATTLWTRALLFADFGRWIGRVTQPPIPGLFRGYPAPFLAVAGDLLPFVALAGVLGVLHATAGGASRVLLGRDRHWLGWVVVYLFAVFVVGLGGEAFGYRVPVAAALTFLIAGLVLRDDRDLAARGIDDGFIRRSFAGRKALFERAIELDETSRGQSVLYTRWRAAEPAKDTYLTDQSQVVVRIRALTSGSGPSFPYEAPERARPDAPSAVDLPQGLAPAEAGLVLGPAGDWWDNGMTAARCGVVLAMVPLGYFVYVVATSQIGNLLSRDNPFGMVTLVINLAYEVSFWLVAAFALGCLYPYLPGDLGAIKGATLASIFALAQGGGTAILGGDVNAWVVRTLELALFLVLLGAWLDLRTLQANQVYWRHLFDFYQLRSVKGVVAYLSPVLLTTIAVVQQYRTGEV
jgi:hypothetical protein